MRTWLLCLCLLAAAALARGAETIPPAPNLYFNDFALSVKPETATRLNQELTDFERTASTQIVTAIFPKMLSASSVEEYAQRVFRAWKIGQKGRDNGVLILVFLEDHKVWIQTGRGVSGALPDATCKDIVSDQILPRFKQNDLDGGMTIGVRAVMQALKGEYKGTGATHYDGESRGNPSSGGSSWIFILIFLALFILPMIFRRRGGVLYTGGGPIFFGGGFGGLGGGGDSEDLPEAHLPAGETSFLAEAGIPTAAARAGAGNES